MPLPTPEFSPWFPWSCLGDGTPADIAHNLCRVGCYLLARFDGDPPAGPADPAEPAVIYIGETHGRSTSLWGRLSAFGNSAGFYGDQWNGHYAAWQYPHRIPGVDRGPGKDGNGRSTSSEGVFVAVCPVPHDLPLHLHGLFPTAIEQQALWRYAEDPRNGGLPVLNNSGRRVVPSAPAMPTLDEPDLLAVLAWDTLPKAGEAAACRIAQTLATEMGYSRLRKTHIARYGRWRGAERTLENGTWLYLGWNEADPAAVTLSVFRGNNTVGVGGAARTIDELRAMLADFWNDWHT